MLIMIKKVKKLNNNVNIKNMEEDKDNLFKMYFTIQEMNGKFSGFVQIGGFETEEEAKIYLSNLAKNDSYSEIITNLPTIH